MADLDLLAHRRALIQAQADARRYVDATGLELDEGSVPLVGTLNALEFPTLASCEGHLDHGEAGPWVRIGHRRPMNPELLPLYEQERHILLRMGDLEPSDETTRKSLREELYRLEAILAPHEQETIRENAALRSRMQDYLDSFNALHPTQEADRLVIEGGPRQGFFDVNAAHLPGADEYEQTPEGQAQLASELERRQSRMEDFTGYLIGLYLEGPEIDTRASEVSLPVSDGRPQLSSLDGLPSPIPPPAPTHSGLEL